jgi:hypothetical protein
LQKGAWWALVEAGSRGLSLFQVLVKLKLFYGKGRNFPINNQ